MYKGSILLRLCGMLIGCLIAISSNGASWVDSAGRTVSDKQGQRHLESGSRGHSFKVGDVTVLDSPTRRFIKALNKHKGGSVNCSVNYELEFNSCAGCGLKTRLYADEHGTSTNSWYNSDLATWPAIPSFPTRAQKKFTGSIQAMGVARATGGFRPNRGLLYKSVKGSDDRAKVKISATEDNRIKIDIDGTITTTDTIYDLIRVFILNSPIIRNASQQNVLSRGAIALLLPTVPLANTGVYDRMDKSIRNVTGEAYPLYQDNNLGTINHSSLSMMLGGSLGNIDFRYIAITDISPHRNGDSYTGGVSLKFEPMFNPKGNTDKSRLERYVAALDIWRIPVRTRHKSRSVNSDREYIKITQNYTLPANKSTSSNGNSFGGIINCK